MNTWNVSFLELHFSSLLFDAVLLECLVWLVVHRELSIGELLVECNRPTVAYVYDNELPLEENHAVKSRARLFGLDFVLLDFFLQLDEEVRDVLEALVLFTLVPFSFGELFEEEFF